MNEQRFLSQLEEFSTAFNDTKGNGVTRFSWSHTATLAQSWLEKEFSRMGISLRADGAGNLHAHIKGKTDLPRVIVGSHLDTVLSDLSPPSKHCAHSAKKASFLTAALNLSLSLKKKAQISERPASAASS